MSAKTKLLTSVAALGLLTGAAVAETSATAEKLPETEMGQPAYAPGWNEDLDRTYADIADRPVVDLVGMNVVTQAGDDVGEVDTFIIMEDQMQAVVGVGGFLGIGEHDVALPLNELEYDGQKLIISYTQEELEAMPEYTEELHELALRDSDTFRTRAADMETDTASADETMPKDEDSTAMNMADGDIEDAAEADAPTGEEVAAAEDAAGGEDTMTEEVAEAEKGAIEQESEEIAAEADAAVTEAGNEVADAAEATGDAIAEGAENAENAAEATGDAIEAGTENVAEAADAAGETVQEGAEELARNVDEAADDWKAALAGFDLDNSNLIGTNVATTNGEVIGEIDGIARHDEKVVALVGIGGFLGLGEHDVALTFDSMSYDGEKFIAEGYTEAELKEMPEYDEATIERIDVSAASQ